MVDSITKEVKRICTVLPTLQVKHLALCTDDGQ